MKKILIAFVTTSGSTQEIAEYIGSQYAQTGLDVDVRPCREVHDLTGYDAVVLGVPMYMFHLHKDAVNFLNRQQRMLVNLPVAVFAGGPFGEVAEKDVAEGLKKIEDELAKMTWLRPVSVHQVGGRFDPARLHFPYNLIPALKQMPPSDLRDWEDIRAWVDSLPGKFFVGEGTAEENQPA